jgi:ATP adenylyltransferase
MTGGDRFEGTILQRLWATWRMKYIASIEREAEGCIFCDLLKVRDGPQNLVAYRGETAYIVLNLYPYNSGHAMVIPQRHVATLPELTDEERLEMMQLAGVLQSALEEGLGAQGFNLGMNLGRVAGAGIPGHLHLHVVPRWLGDTNFMPVVGEARVLPESLADTYVKVRDAIQRTLAREGMGA